jgi:hypothetical protein
MAETIEYGTRTRRGTETAELKHYYRINRTVLLPCSYVHRREISPAASEAEASLRSAQMRRGAVSSAS